MLNIPQSIVPDGPVEFRSVRAMDEYIKANAGPLISDTPCACGEDKESGHRYCPRCKTVKPRTKK